MYYITVDKKGNCLNINYIMLSINLIGEKGDT